MRQENQPRVCLFHPGTQHSFRLASELKRHELLTRFVTSIYRTKSARDFLLGLGKLGRSINKKLERRSSEELNGYVIQWPWPEIIHLFFSRAGIGSAYAWIRWRNRLFGKWVAKHCLNDIDIVWGFDTSSLEVFEEAKQRNIKCILDMSITHPLENESIIRFHINKRPEYALDIGEINKSPEEIERRKEEMRLADLIVAASSYTKKTLVNFGVPPDKIVVNPYGVDLSLFHALPKSEFSPPIIFLFVAWFSQRKGIYYLLEAWERAGLSSGCELWLAGGGNEDLRCWKRPLPKNVRILGRLAHSQLAGVYQKAHVFVFPSLFEGFGLVILESMAAGLPVITTYNTAGPDLINHGENGYLVKDGDVEALSEAMTKFIENPPLIQTMGTEARKIAERYTWAAYGGRCAVICRNLIEIEKTLS